MRPSAAALHHVSLVTCAEHMHAGTRRMSGASCASTSAMSPCVRCSTQSCRVSSCSGYKASSKKASSLLVSSIRFWPSPAHSFKSTEFGCTVTRQSRRYGQRQQRMRYAHKRALCQLFASRPSGRRASGSASAPLQRLSFSNPNMCAYPSRVASIWLLLQRHSTCCAKLALH